ncbi:MAG: hemerythrin domain-containing protein [Hyphomicrobiales bacterium]|nr:hemerythrin domain-containing protein [Hyphomicrobiales bacterium]
MSIDHQALATHVAMRDGLPQATRPTLLEEAQCNWEQHPGYAGKAKFFKKVHRQLIDGTHQIAGALETILDLPPAGLPDTVRRSGLVSGGQRLVAFAHGHHEIEDRGYFPQFALLYPKLGQALALLDGDHRVLDETLYEVETRLGRLAHGGATPDQITDLYRHARALEKIMVRHITDEEDVIIPIFLRHG